MLFIVHAIFKPDVEEERVRVHEQYNDHLRQPFLHLRLGGPLCDPTGRRSGVFMLVEADDMVQVETFVSHDPYGQAGLYARVDINSLNLEIGRLA